MLTRQHKVRYIFI